MELAHGTEVSEGNTIASDKYRNYCFTSFIGKIEFKKNMKYLLQGEEVCPTTGRDHIQGFVIFKNPRKLSGVIKEFGKISWRVCRGSIEDNIKYCKKELSFSEEGVLPTGQGKRLDLQQIKEEIDEGKSINEIAQDHVAAYIRYHSGIEKYKRLSMKHRNEKPTVVWIWGLSGVGKTKYVFDRHESIYMKDGSKWWDGYEQQEAICIDDFDGRWPYRDLLRLLDRYPYQGETKGGYVKLNSPFIYITCEYPPDEYYGEEKNRLDQVVRRIDNTIHLTGDH